MLGLDEAAVVFGGSIVHGISFSGARYKQLLRIAVDCRLFAVRLRACRRVRLEVIGS